MYMERRKRTLCMIEPLPKLKHCANNEDMANEQLVGKDQLE